MERPSREPEASGTRIATFAEVTTLRPEGPDLFGAVASPDWTIGGKPNGGYLLAMLGRAAIAVSAHRDVIAASASYLSAPVPGPVLIEAESLRAGRTISQVRAKMIQGERTRVEALLTVGELDPETKPYWTGDLPEPGQVGYEDCPRVTPPPEFRIAIMEQVEVRLEPGGDGHAVARPAGQGELRGWLSLPGGESFDPVSLLYAADAFPPATLDIEPTGWVPTLSLTVYVRALPAPGPVRVLQRATLIDGERVDESCFVWDQTGRLVAQATQLAAIRIG